MKLYKNILFTCVLLLGTTTTQAQFWKKLGKKIEKVAEETVNRKVEDKAAEKTENVMDSILNADKKLKKRKKRKRDINSETTIDSKEDVSDNKENNIDENTNQKNLKPWSNYNFISGDKIIFQDDLMYEENGEFPSRWDLISGSAENAILDSDQIINLENNTVITPLMDKETYLPEVFTIEFDAYFFSEKDFGSGWQYYDIRFSPKATKNYSPEDSEDTYYPIVLKRDGVNLDATINGIKKEFQGTEKELDIQPTWRHFAIAFNKRSLKVFIDQYRVLNIPNMGKNFRPQQFSINAHSYYADGYVRAIKNIRIAEGGKKLYERIVVEGKYVTRGILFEINTSALKPESMGIINRVTKMMQQHAELGFMIEGHTDSDGDEASNLELSSSRALAVKNALISAGIDENRLQTDGKGESIPVSDNATPEGKANNRRVEFIVLKK